MAISYVGKGAFGSGTAGVTAGAITGVQADDLIVLLVESANEAIATPSGYTQAANSPVSTGTAASAGGVRLAVFYMVATGADASDSVADTGNHTTTIKFAFRGVDPTTPMDATPVSGIKTPASTSTSFPGITTVTDGAWIVHCSALDLDAASTATTGTPTNANLTGLTEIHDQTVTSAAGGGLVAVYGTKATAGATGNTTASVTSTVQVYLTLALRPQGSTAHSGAITEAASADDSPSATLSQSAGVTEGLSLSDGASAQSAFQSAYEDYNLLAYSWDFTQSYWRKQGSGGAASVTLNGTGPTGDPAYTFTGSGLYNSLSPLNGIQVSAGRVLTCVWYVQAGTLSTGACVDERPTVGAEDSFANFNLTTLTFGISGVGTNITGSVVDVGGGWRKITANYTIKDSAQGFAVPALWMGAFNATDYTGQTIIVSSFMANVVGNTTYQSTNGGGAANAVGVPTLRAAFQSSQTEPISPAETDDATAAFSSDTTEPATSADSTDSTLTPGGLTASTTEPASATESSDSTRGQFSTTTEAAASSDSASALAAFQSTVTEGAAGAESAAASQGQGSATSEPASAADSPSAQAGFQGTVTEASAASDSPSALAAFQSAVTEAAAAADTVSTLGAQFSGDVTEAVAGADQVNSTKTQSASAQEAAGASETVNSTASLNTSVSEPLAASDSAVWVFGQFATQQDAAAASDATSAVRGQGAGVAEAVSAAESVAAALAAVAVVAEAVTAAEQLAAIRQLIAHASEAVAALDSVDATAASAVELSSISQSLTAAARILELQADPRSLELAAQARDLALLVDARIDTLAAELRTTNLIGD